MAVPRPFPSPTATVTPSKPPATAEGSGRPAAQGGGRSLPGASPLCLKTTPYGSAGRDQLVPGCAAVDSPAARTARRWRSPRFSINRESFLEVSRPTVAPVGSSKRVRRRSYRSAPLGPHSPARCRRSEEGSGSPGWPCWRLPVRLAAVEGEVVEDEGGEVWLEERPVQGLEEQVAAVGVLPPEPRQGGGVGGRLEAAVGPTEPVGDKLFADHLDRLEPRPAGGAGKLAGGEGVDVDDRLQLGGAVVPAVVVVDGPWLGAHSKPPERRQSRPQPLGDGG